MSDSRGCGRAFLAVGSNIQPRKNIAAALDLLSRPIEILAVSTFYRTAPIGGGDQPAFLNGVWCVALPDHPASLKTLCRDVEHLLGRRRTTDRYAPRPIDLDVVYRDDEGDVSDPDLRRPFVCVPLVEVAPDLAEGPIGEFARRAGDPGEIDEELTRTLRAMLDQ
ncbi:MAG: 2-amino-4-hydroxy-6-hydroxymethyldihydropteridine diphosphokinase [Phycisphaerae bacterium]